MRMTKHDPPRQRTSPLSPAPDRTAAFQTGLSAESRAAAWLIAKGYRILARRYRSGVGEIDIIARRMNLTVFVEVKARAKLDDAAYAITPQQQRRIIAAAEAWLAAHPERSASDLRFDAVLVAPGHLPRHIMAAFDASA
jgi:putative endonuclease